MTLERHRSNQRMSQAVRSGNQLYLAGQVAKDPVPDIAEQTRQIFRSIEELLVMGGSSKQNMVSAMIWITDMDNFAAMNAVWDAWIAGENPPARACVQARLARSELLVEIQVVAQCLDTDVSCS
jgi:enamine deaminase RidA (YjgF/YER057c/UK114 family)